MENILSTTMGNIAGLVRDALDKAMDKGLLKRAELPEFVVEIPADTKNGDFATNAAMVCARTFGRAPRDIAAVIKDEIDLQATEFDRCEVAGPGFINFFLAKQWFASALQSVINQGENYGRSSFGKGEKIMVEFVSANPTGPMHMGNARGGAIGDCLAAALDWAGYDVTREFYINDAGNQIERFALSLDARYKQVCGIDQPVPEDGYQGEDILEHARKFYCIHGDKYISASEEERRAALVDYALPLNIEKMKRDLASYRINYDVWFNESSLHNSGSVKAVIDTLSSKGLTYEKDGAIWYKATEFGGEKDEVLIRSGGHPTYFAADIAYHYNKFAQRGFNRVINIWGADHHGHVARLKGAMDAVGLDGSKLDIVLMQLVRLMKDGKPVKMSKRTGKAITLTDLIEDVPVDAARFFFNMREPNSTLDFDLDLAAEQSSQNPVYYVQYAHARICSIIKNLGAEGIDCRCCTPEELEQLGMPEEQELIRLVAKMPSEIIEAAKNYDPARLTHYAVDVATLFHKFYNNCRVKCEDEVLMQSRLSLCMAVRTVLRNLLSLLKISAPETM